MIRLKPNVPNLTYALIETTINCGDKLPIRETKSNTNIFGYHYGRGSMFHITGMYVKRTTTEDPYKFMVEVSHVAQGSSHVSRLLLELGIHPEITELVTYTRFHMPIAHGIHFLSELNKRYAL